MAYKDFDTIIDWAITTNKVPKTLYMMMSAYQNDIDPSKVSNYISIIKNLPDSKAKIRVINILETISKENNPNMTNLDYHSIMT